MAAPSPAAPHAPTPPTPDTPLHRPWRRRALQAAGILLLFGIGIGTGAAFRPAPSLPNEPGDSPIETTKPRERLANVDGDPTDILERGDKDLLRHRFREALVSYQSLLDKSAVHASLLYYRTGICRESLAQTDLAIASYRKSLTSADGPRVANASRIGMARCWLKEAKSTEVRRILYPILMDEELQAQLPRALLAEARFLVALAFAQDARPIVKDRFALDEIIPIPPDSLRIFDYLDDLANPKTTTQNKPSSKSATNDAKPIQMRKRIKDQPAHIERIAVRDLPAIEVLDRLAAEAGLKSVWSAKAKQRTEARKLTAAAADLGVVELAELLADNIDVVCVAAEDTLRYSTVEECAEKLLLETRGRTAARAFNAAMKTDTSHFLAPAAYVELGAIDVRAGKLADALVWYERARREFPYSPFVTQASYNRGQIHIRRHEIELAVKAFYDAIDQSPGHEMALRSYMRIGVLYLEEERTNEAILPLRRAQSLAPESPYQPVATLSLAAAYLKMNDPALARSAMARYRPSLYKEPYKGSAAILDAYARYLLAKVHKSHQTESADLLSAMDHHKATTLLGSLGQYLIAQAYIDLGFWSRAEVVLADATKKASGPIERALTYRHGKVLLHLLQRESAQKCFAKLQPDESPYRVPALYQLARIDGMESRWKECTVRCAKLWSDKTFKQHAELLSLWGTALESMGEYAKAARCYAGQAPE